MDRGELLFVYGALRSAAERQRLLGRPVDEKPATLEGYARGRKKYFYAMKSPDAVTEGAILDLDARELDVLDEYEEVPTLYTRVRVEVTAAEGRRVECWIYLPTSWAGE